MKHLSLVASVALLATALATPAVAQETSTTAYNNEVGVQYSSLKDVGRYGTTGLLMDFGHKLTTTGKVQTSVVGEFALNHFSRFSETYMQAAAGVRFGAMATPKVRAYGQVMVGTQREFGLGGTVIQPGGGVSVRTSKKMDARVQLDFPVVHWNNHTYKQFRFSAGVGLSLGRN